MTYLFSKTTQVNGHPPATKPQHPRMLATQFPRASAISQQIVCVSISHLLHPVPVPPPSSASSLRMSAVQTAATEGAPESMDHDPRYYLDLIATLSEDAEAEREALLRSPCSHRRLPCHFHWTSSAIGRVCESGRLVTDTRNRWSPCDDKDEVSERTVGDGWLGCLVTVHPGSGRRSSPLAFVCYAGEFVMTVRIRSR